VAAAVSSAFDAAPPPVSIPAPAAPPTKSPDDQAAKAEMVFIPAGTFTMGDTHGDGNKDEKPTHPVSVAAFWLDKTEVTTAQFARFVQAGNIVRENWQDRSISRDQHPVVWITWYSAVAYCKWMRKRLPAEAEWEYAARGTDGRKYPWGNQWDENRAVAFVDNRGPHFTATVGSYPSGASPFGILDLVGNVMEWTLLPL
jgi:formylglycine-generating enzyme required for sulfatase activity